MKNLIFGYNDFLALFNFRKCTFAEFERELSILNITDKSGTFAVRSHIDDFLDKVVRKSTDTRKVTLDQYKKNLYKMLVEEPEISLRFWWNRYGELTNNLEFYLRMESGSCLVDDTFMGMKNSKYGRICKNINFESFYNTKKLYDNDSEYTFGLLKAMYEGFKIRNSLAGPAFYDHILQLDYNKIWLDFMMGANKASVFNPYTYRSILDELFTGDTVFAPVMGWNAYQTAFYTSNFKHFIATDVIPSVVDNGKLLQEEYEKGLSTDPFNRIFHLDPKTVDLYLCPSEQLDKKHNFVEKYRNKVDAVLFSPPYYDLEIYDSEDQSIANFPKYEDWLEGYWAETVKICAEVMRPGAKFGFVISNYRNHDKEEVNISQDMKLIADRFLTPVNRYKVRWSSMGGSRQAHKMRAGNYEDLWLYTK